MAEPQVRREHISDAPLDGEGILYARLALGPHQNLVYLAADPTTREAIVIDPAFDVDRILDIVDGWDAKLTGAFFTHHHWDHIEGAPRLAETTQVPLYVHSADAASLREKNLDVIAIEDGHRHALGDHDLIAHHTPGHTAGGTTYQLGRRLFTGDLLFIGQAGRTDFPTGSKRVMWESIGRIKRFPDDHILCPGHDYGDVPEATLAHQKRRSDPFLQPDFDHFKDQWYLEAY